MRAWAVLAVACAAVLARAAGWCNDSCNLRITPCGFGARKIPANMGHNFN